MSVDVVSECDVPDTRSSTVHLYTSEYIPPTPAPSAPPQSQTNLLLHSATDQTRASSPQLVVCKHLVNDDDHDVKRVVVKYEDRNRDKDCKSRTSNQSYITRSELHMTL